jgi:branched-chain amino acid transport system substrate-binding protein
MPTIHGSPVSPSGARPRRATAVVLAALLLLAAACGDDDTEDAAAGGESEGTSETTAGASDASDVDDVLGPIDEASGEPVRVGFISDGQHEAFDLSVEFDVADATTQYVNERLGGIGGRPLELVTCEAKLEPTRATDCANQMVEQEVVAVLVGTTGVSDAVWQPLNDAGLPSFWFAGTAEAMLSDPETTFIFSNPLGLTVGVPLTVAEAEGAEKAIAVLIDVPAAVEPFENEGLPAFEDAGIDLELVPVPPGTPDMTAQLQPALDGTGLVHIVGNDSFCVAAFQALATLGYDGAVTAVSPCISDATRTALGDGELEGAIVPTAAPYGVEDETTELYRTVFETYGSDVDTSRAAPANTFQVIAGFATALDDIDGEITAESIIATAKAMPDRELPGGAGLRVRCNGAAAPDSPAICVRGTLTATLDAEGQTTGFEPTDTDPIGD